MNAVEIAHVLAKAAAFDARTVGEADILAWHEAIGHLGLDDALAAVTRHYANSTDRLMPAHVIAEARTIRNERAAARQHEVRALPSRFEPDEIRDERVRAGVAKLAQLLAVPGDTAGGDAHSRALTRARSERGRRPVPGADQPRRPGKPIDWSKVPGPEWTSDGAREAASIAALHEVGRSCGRSSCSNCRREGTR